MNARLFSFALVSLALVLLVSGCISGPAGGSDGTSGTSVTEGQSAAEQDAQALAQVGEDLLSENDTVEIGEMV